MTRGGGNLGDVFRAHEDSDRLAIMHQGRIAEQGTYEAILRSTAHPYTDALVRCVPRPDPDNREVRAAVTGEVPSLLNRPRGCDFHTRCAYAQARGREEEPAAAVLPGGRRVRCHFPLA